MKNPEFGPSKSLMSEAKRITAVAVLFAGGLALDIGNASGAELAKNPAQVQDQTHIESPHNRLQERYKTLNQSIKHTKEVLHHPFNYIKDGDKTGFLNMTLTGKEKTTVWLDVACSGTYNLNFWDWQGYMNDNTLCRDTGTIVFENLKPGNYTLYIEDSTHTDWAVGSSVKMKEIPKYPTTG